MRDYHIYMNRTKAACFGCRKSWAWNLQTHKNSSNICPQCGKALYFVGLDFKAPRKSEIKQWLKIEKLVRAGIRFAPTGWQMDGPGPRPATLGEVDEFLRAEIERHRSVERARRANARDELLSKRRKRRGEIIKSKRMR